MLMRKNSIEFRVEVAEMALGHRVAEDGLDVELALAVCHWPGPGGSGFSCGPAGDDSFPHTKRAPEVWSQVPWGNDPPAFRVEIEAVNGRRCDHLVAGQPRCHGP